MKSGANMQVAKKFTKATLHRGEKKWNAVKQRCNVKTKKIRSTPTNPPSRRQRADRASKGNKKLKKETPV